MSHSISQPWWTRTGLSYQFKSCVLPRDNQLEERIFGTVFQSEFTFQHVTWIRVSSGPQKLVLRFQWWWHWRASHPAQYHGFTRNISNKGQQVEIFIPLKIPVIHQTLLNLLSVYLEADQECSSMLCKTDFMFETKNTQQISDMYIYIWISSLHNPSHILIGRPNFLTCRYLHPSQSRNATLHDQSPGWLCLPAEEASLWIGGEQRGHDGIWLYSLKW